MQSSLNAPAPAQAQRGRSRLRRDRTWIARSDPKLSCSSSSSSSSSSLDSDSTLDSSIVAGRLVEIETGSNTSDNNTSSSSSRSGVKPGVFANGFGIGSRSRQRKVFYLQRLETKNRKKSQKTWSAVSSDGKVRSIRTRQVSFVIPGSDLSPECIDRLFLESDKLIRSSPSLSASDSESSIVDSLWKQLCRIRDESSMPSEFGPWQTAALLFGRQTPISVYAAYCLLDGNTAYFSRVKSGNEESGGTVFDPLFRCRSEEQVAESIASMRKQEADSNRIRAMIEQFIQRMESDGKERKEHSLSDLRPLVDMLETYALQRKPSSEQSFLCASLCEVLGVPLPLHWFDATELLQKSGAWPPHHIPEMEELKRADLGVRFPDSVVRFIDEILGSATDSSAHASHYPLADEDESSRMDLENQRVIAVDDLGTLEVDDAIALERRDDGVHRVWVHIADTTRYVERNSVLDLEARRRSTSLYLPMSMVPMFPLPLVVDFMSLSCDRTCCTLSFFMEFDTESGSIMHQRSGVVPGRVRMRKAMTYEQLEVILQSDTSGAEDKGDQDEANTDSEAEALVSDIHLLNHIAQKRKAYRRRNRAFDFQNPSLSLKVEPGEKSEEFEIKAYNSSEDSSTARAFVAEFMIAVGEVAATLGVDHGIALPFRGQKKPNIPKGVLENVIDYPSGPCTAAHYRSYMSKVEISVSEPKEHSTLGLPAYVQASSPIRRYCDHITHYQIKSFIRKEPLALSTAAELKVVVQNFQEANRFANQIARQTNRYWLMEYLSRQPVHRRTFQALILRWHDYVSRTAQVRILALSLETIVQLDGSVRIGDTVLVYVHDLDFRQRRIFFKRLREPPHSQSPSSSSL